MSPTVDYDKLAAQHGGANYDSLAGAAQGGPVEASNTAGLPPSRFLGPAALLGAGALAGKAVGAVAKGGPAARALGSRASQAAINTLSKDPGPLGHIIRFYQEMQGATPSEAPGVPSRPIQVKGKPAARAPIPTAEPKYTGGRGASKPELARRAAALEAASKPNLSIVPREIPTLPQAASLEEQLQQALAAEQAMTARGVPVGQERVPLRAGLRGAMAPEGLVGGGGNLALMILSMLNAPQQMAESEALFRRIKMEEDRKRMNPSTFRALYGQPQGN